MPELGLKLDRHGIGEALKSRAMRRMVDDATRRMADRVRSDVRDANVITDSYTTDRAAGAVVIADVRGMLYQAQHGTLTKAAKAIGADVRPRSRR